MFLGLAGILLFYTTSFAEENVCGPMTPTEEQVVKLQQDTIVLHAKIKELEERKWISPERLKQKKVERLKEIAVDAKLQRLTTSDFQGFVTWMNSNLVGYNRYILAGSSAAVLARMLPIPYAGQASLFTKFVAQFMITLNSASLSINTYLTSSQKFLLMAEEIDPAKPLDLQTVSAVSTFADQHFLKDMNDAQIKLAAVSDLSSGALSFLESLNNYASGTDEYLYKAKGMFTKDIDLKEKSFLSESTGALKLQATKFNGKLKLFEELGKKQATSLKSLAVFDELLTELSGS
jgi:hypothetical protein